MTNFYYRCFDCGKIFARDDVRYVCLSCSDKCKPKEPLHGVLETIFDYTYIQLRFNLQQPNWQLFSPVENEYYPSYPSGNTPFFPAARLATALGHNNLWIKHDGLNPSGSLKDRAAFLVVAEANRLGEEKIAIASTGNAASALAAVAAAAGKQAVVFVPESTPITKLAQIMQCGAKVFPVHGPYEEAFQISLQYTQQQGGMNSNNAYQPLTIEGEKTVGFEVFTQNNFTIPDAMVVPVGDGVLISAVYKAFYDLMMAKVSDKMPRLIAIQAEHSDAVYNYIGKGIYRNALNPRSVADSIVVSAPSNAHMAKRAVEKTQGFSLLVSDEEILSAQTLLAHKMGVFAEPAAAATVAGMKKICDQKLLPQNAQVVLLITGHGLKDIKAAMTNMRLPSISNKQPA